MYLQFYTAAQHDSFPVDAMQMLISGSEISSMTCSIINNCYSDIITISGYFLFTPVYNTVISTFIIVFSKYICSLHHVIERGKHCLCWWIQTHDVILVADIIFNPLLILFLKIFYYYLFFILFLFHSLISNIWAIFQALNLHCNDVFVWWCSSWCADSSLITSANVNRKNMSVGHRGRTGGCVGVVTPMNMVGVVFYV